MASQTLCTVDDGLLELLKKFRFRKEKNNAAIIMKIDKENLKIILEEELEDCDLEEVCESLSEHSPRYLVYSFKQEHGDGRISYPMCFVFISPQAASAQLKMMYAGSKLELVNASGMTKSFEVRSLEELTEEWLVEKLKRLY